MFISVQVLEVSPAVLSPGTLCEDSGYSCEWKERNYPHYPRMDKVIHCRSDTCVQIVAPGVVVDTRPRSDADAASGHRPPTASGGPEQDLPDWLQPFTEGLVEGAWDGETTKGISQVDVEKPA